MRIAVVIPALDEAESIETAVASTRGALGLELALGSVLGPEAGLEVVVVDGGSRDDTADRARAAGARVVASPPGRARQLEAGWRAVRGDAVLFLHADTRLPEGWDAAVRGALADAGVAGGAFALRFDRRTPASLRLIEWGARLRVAILGLPYGDQALFARRSALEAIGGIAPVPICEDLDLVRALRQRGRLAALAQPATTSARRYLRRGPARAWWRNALVLLGWRLGVDRARLAAWYAR